METMTENADPNLLSIGSHGGQGQGHAPTKTSGGVGVGGFGSVVGVGGTTSKPPLSKKRVSISPKKSTILSPGGSRARNGRRRSSSHFGTVAAAAAGSNNDADEDDDDIEFTLDGAAGIGGGNGGENNMMMTTIDGAPTVAAATTAAAANKSKNKAQQRRRRRSSSRFLQLATGDFGEDGDANGADGDATRSPGSEDGDDFTSSEHLGEIYRQAIRMNAENKINAGNSWGFKLIENMDKFLAEDGGNSNNGNSSPRDDGREDLMAARQMKSRDDKGRVNFAKASCTLDASVKIYSYRVDDVHLSSFRVLANLNRSDNKKDDDVRTDENGGGVEEAAGEKVVKRRTGPRGPTETLETNLANINMSKLDSAYDIDPLFHKMSKSFDEGGAKGLLLGNLGVSENGCHIVFDSKEDKEEQRAGGARLDKINEEGDEADEFNIDPDEAVVWNEKDIDITNLAAKLESMLASYGHRTSSSVPFVPQLESLRCDYAALEEEGFVVDEKDALREGRKALRLYDAPEEEEKEAERSIHVIALERSRGSVLGMSFDTNFRMSMGMGDDDDDDDNVGESGGFGAENFGGEGEFAPDTASFGGGGEFSPGSGGNSASSQQGSSYTNTKVLLDAICNGDLFYEGGSGGLSDYAFFDMDKFEKATDGNFWAGSQHWKKKPAPAKKDGTEKKKVMFDDATAGKKERKTAVKKDRFFIDFNMAPNVNAIFEKKKATKTTKATKKDQYQMPQADRDFLLPPDANVDISQLTRLFSRPNAVVRKTNGNNDEPMGKTVGFHDIDANALGFNDDDDDGCFDDNNDGGFNFAYDDEDDAPRDDDADYNIEFDEVRKVEKINITYATVAKKVDVRRLKQDLWAELEEKTARVTPEVVDPAGEDDQDNIDDKGPSMGEPRFVSFKETVDKMEMAQSQNDVTVSFYFICCLHLANEKGLKLDSTGLEDFLISLDDGSAPTFGKFGDGFTETVNKLSSVANNRE